MCVGFSGNLVSFHLMEVEEKHVKQEKNEGKDKKKEEHDMEEMMYRRREYGKENDQEQENEREQDGGTSTIRGERLKTLKSIIRTAKLIRLAIEEWKEKRERIEEDEKYKNRKDPMKEEKEEEEGKETAKGDGRNQWKDKGDKKEGIRLIKIRRNLKKIVGSKRKRKKGRKSKSRMKRGKS